MNKNVFKSYALFLTYIKCVRKKMDQKSRYDNKMYLALDQ